MDKLLKAAQEVAYSEEKRTGMPLLKHIDLSRDVGVRLAGDLKADSQIVEIGTLLMDCMIGEALQQNRLEDHVQMSLDRTNELLSEFDIDESAKENIRHCVTEHHGVDKYHSLESEICANADCYRFISIKGFMCAVRYLRDMEFEDLVVLLNNKVDEKWGVLSLESCKKELTPEYELIKGVLEGLK